MMSIFNFFGSVLGYLLWFLYTVFKNYGIAIILFTIIVKALMFPFSIKSQKSMAAQSRLASKQQELQKKYAKDQMKYNEELQKLYEKEGVNPGGGCLTTLLPFPIMLGIYYSVIYPLSNTLHIAKDTISQATEFVSKIPGIASTNQYVELEIVKNFDALKDHLTMFSADDVQKIEFFGKGFKCFGLDLLASPNTSSFASMLWIIPVLALVTYWGQSFVMQKLQPTQQQGAGQPRAQPYQAPHAPVIQTAAGRQLFLHGSVLLPFFDEHVEKYVDEHNEQKQHQADGEQGLLIQAAHRGIGHAGDDAGQLKLAGFENVLVAYAHLLAADSPDVAGEGCGRLDRDAEIDVTERADGGDCLAAGDLGRDELGVVDKLLADLRLGKLRDLSGLVLKKNGEGHLMRVVGNRSRCLFADELPADGCDDCHNENNHQKVNQIDFAEQTTLFINNFHTCLQLLGIWLIPHGK